MDQNIITCIINLVKNLITYNYQNGNFIKWLNDSSSEDFKYIYEREYKRLYLPFFTTDSERIIGYYSQNLSYSIISYIRVAEIDKLLNFIETFIQLQLKDLTKDDLFMEPI
jgi:hypothetical protein